jgi:hypothetical protein
MTRYLYLSALAALSAFAQLTTTVTAGPAGRSEITILNNSAAPLEAFAVTWTMPREPSGTRTSLSCKDALLQVTFKPLPAGAQTILTVPGSPALQAQVRAGIFQDGSTFGDREWVDVLRQRRALYLQAVDAFLNELQAGAGENITRDALIQQLTASRDRQIANLASTAEPEVADALSTDLSPQRVIRGTPRECITVVFHFIMQNVTRPPTYRDGSGMLLPDIVTTLTRLLKEQKLKLVAAASK